MRNMSCRIGSYFSREARQHSGFTGNGVAAQVLFKFCMPDIRPIRFLSRRCVETAEGAMSAPVQTSSGGTLLAIREFPPKDEMSSEYYIGRFGRIHAKTVSGSQG